MAALKGLLLCSLLWILSLGEGKEFTVVCLSWDECVLPCQFQSDGRGARVMWYKKKAVVSCTRYGDTNFVVGHNSPTGKYRGRTDLFADQVLEGNATLRLRNVTPNDQGKYFCITMTAPRTDQSGIISLIVKAPVRAVNMEFSGDKVICGAEGIFPAPTLTWSTDPPTDEELLRNKTKIQKTRLGFYNIQSSVVRGNTDQIYICSVTGDTNRRTAFLKHEGSIVTSPGSDVMIPCSLPHSVLHNFNLTWRFRRSDPIVSISVIDQTSQVEVWDQWEHHVNANLSALSSLHLHGLRPKHQGTYTCEVSTPEETHITWTEVTVTEDCAHYIYISVIIGLCCVLGLLLMVLFRLNGRRSERSGAPGEDETDESTESLNVDVTGDQAAEEEERQV